MSQGSSEGGLAARRAVVRWAWRLFRREWRQQALVLALLSVAVAAAVGVASAAYNVLPGQPAAVLGSADHFLRADGSDPQALDAAVGAAEDWFGTIEVIGHNQVPVEGLSGPLELRAQDPEGPYGGPRLALHDGRYPANDTELALTDGLSDEMRLAIGDGLEFEGTERTVVGLVENPSDLDDEFALVVPAGNDAPDSVTILLGGSSERVESFRAPGDAVTEVGVRSGNEALSAAVVVLGVAEVVLLFVSLVAAAGFVVMAQRRLRQLGMLAAIGAATQHLRLVMVANGALVGAFAAVVGTLVGLAGWVVAAPRMETAAQQRLDPLNVPWWLIATAMVLAVVTATGAALWPARVVARVSVVRALSGRPPAAQPARRSAALAGVLIALGLGCLASAGDVDDGFSVNWTNVLLVGVGMVATVVGVLLVSPLALRLLGRAAAPLPAAIRLALRDLARYQARSGMALAAISLALGIPVAVVITATAAEHSTTEGNLSDRQLLIPPGASEGPFVPDWSSSELAQLEDDVDRIVAEVDSDATVTALEVAADPRVEPEREGERSVIGLARRVGDTRLDIGVVHVATPELLELYGLDESDVRRGTELISSETEADELSYSGVLDPASGSYPPQRVENIQQIEPGYTSLPTALMTSETLAERGWEPVPAGWLAETRGPVDREALAAARQLAADAGLTIETRRGQGGLAQLRSGATAVGILLALGVMAMTVGLIRSEAERDLRTLTATGATSTFRRTLTAATAAGLALLGVTLGTVGAYLGVAAGYLDDISSLIPVPALHLALIAGGVPLAAGVAGWLLAGREPTGLARQAIE
ncbi:MAG: FtsX-like permease family protein [Jiangellaceae bacterium]